jgi:hypothetical protein
MVYVNLSIVKDYLDAGTARKTNKIQDTICIELLQKFVHSESGIVINPFSNDCSINNYSKHKWLGVYCETSEPPPPPETESIFNEENSIGIIVFKETTNDIPLPTYKNSKKIIHLNNIATDTGISIAPLLNAIVNITTKEVCGDSNSSKGIEKTVHSKLFTKSNKFKKLVYYTPLCPAINGNGCNARFQQTLKMCKDYGMEIILVSPYYQTNNDMKWTHSRIKDIKKSLIINHLYLIKNNTEFFYVLNTEKPDYLFVNYYDSFDESVYEKLSTNDCYAGITKILDTHDLYVKNNYLRQYITHPNSSSSIIDLNQITLELNKYNFMDYSPYYKHLDVYDHILNISKNENCILKKYTTDPDKCIHFPYKVMSKSDTTPDAEASTTPGKRVYITWVASDNILNLHAYKFFIEYVLDLIHPGIPILIVGNISNSIPIKHPRIVYTGFVDSLDSIYRLTKFTFCPILLGTGSKIKIAESIEYNCPVVSMLHSGEDSEIRHSINGLLAIDREDFANKINGLYFS